MEVDEQGSSGDAAAAQAVPAERKAKVYALMAAQLRADGLAEAADAVAAAASGAPDANGAEDGALVRMVLAQLDAEEEERKERELAAAAAAAADEDGGAKKAKGAAQLGAPPFPKLVQRFVTSHKGPCRAGAFSGDGDLAATGSEDHSIKLIDVNRVRYYSRSSHVGGGGDDAARPVIKTFYDHTAPVSDLAFHPSEPFLVSASRDCTIRFFNTSRLHARRSARHVADTHAVRSIHLHPSGDFLLAGTDHPMVRVYDVNTLKSFVSADANQHHFGPITCVRFAPDASVFASSSKDGSVKLWDTVNNRVANTIRNAHSGAEVSSVEFSDDSRYLLTSGKDGETRRWEISTGRQVDSYSGARHRSFNHGAVFDFSGDYIMAPDEASGHVLVWSATTADVVSKITGHAALVRKVAVSPVDGGILTCGDDSRARFWVVDK